MQKITKLAAFAMAFALAVTAFFAPAANAAPVSKPAAMPSHATAFDGKVIKVQRRRWRRGGRRWRRGGRGWGRGVAIGTGVVLGALLLSEAARANARRSGAWERCADRYRSFDYERGTIVTYDGDVILCPYLR